MLFIEWNNNFNIGVNIFDEQHQQLVSLVNNSYNSIQLNNTQEAKKTLDELVDYIKYHLSTEERLMQEYNYPSIDEHEISHSIFCSKLHDLQVKLNTNDSLYNTQLVVFLKDWLMDHILIADRDLAKYIIGKDTSGS
jgi:hemerythrin